MSEYTIMEYTYFDHIKGMDITVVTCGVFSTRIARWKDNKCFQLSLNTHPKSWLLVTDTDFKTVKKAKEYYLDTLQLILETTLEVLKQDTSAKTEKAREE